MTHELLNKAIKNRTHEEALRRDIQYLMSMHDAMNKVLDVTEDKEIISAFINANKHVSNYYATREIATACRAMASAAMVSIRESVSILEAECANVDEAFAAL